MVRRLSKDSPRKWRKDSRRYLAFSWVSGLAGGCLAYLLGGESLHALMRGVLYAPVSIVGILCVSLLPFLLSAYAVFLSNLSFLLPICFLKAWLFSQISLGIYQAFSSAGWLMRILLLFSSWTSLPILYWFWLRYLSPEHRASTLEALLACSLLLLVGSIHIRVISPFLVCLIET